MKKLRSALVHYAQGLLMGGSDVIPGVSGGTMALIVGIYRRLIDSISSLFSLVLGLIRFDGDAVRLHSKEVEWRLLIPLGLGIVTAIILAATVILDLVTAYPEESQGLFFGLVAASIAIPWLRIDQTGSDKVLIAVAAAALAFWLVSLPPQSASQPTLIRVFGSASVAICAMILPGVSGAFLLKAFGIYEVTLEAGRGALALNGADILYVLTFMAGAAIGLGVFSKILNWLLKRYKDITMAALVGLMAGALRALWPWLDGQGGLQWPGPGDPIWSVLILALAGFVFIVLLTWWSASRLEEDPQHPSTA